MTSYPFIRRDDESLVVVESMVDGEEVFIAIDTGATHTLIDLTTLIYLGYSMEDAIGTTQFATAKGIAHGWIFLVKKFSVLGITKTNIPISSADF